MKKWLLFSEYIPSDGALNLFDVYENIFDSYSFGSDTISILNIIKEKNSKENKVQLWFLFSAYFLLRLYICTKFHENIDDRFKVIVWTQFSKGHNSAKNIAGVMNLILCTSSDDALYLYQVL